MHRQVARAQALGAGLPLLLAVQRAERLQHRHVAAEGACLRRLRVGLGEAGGIEDHRRTGLVQPRLDLLQAGGLLEAGYCDRQRIQTCDLQALAEDIDEFGVGRLHLRPVEQQRRHRAAFLPVGAPVLQRRLGVARVMDQSAG
ncbi:hypothetical protein D9M71_672400 [compost metagenome]